MLSDLSGEQREEFYVSKAREVLRVASPSQLKVFNNFQAGTERLFLGYFDLKWTNPITVKVIDDVLKLIVNSVEGDVSQLESEHEKYARRKGWLKGFE